MVLSLPQLSQSKRCVSSAWRRDARIWKTSEYKTLEEALDTTHKHIKFLSPSNLAAFWAVAPHLLDKHIMGGKQDKRRSRRNQLQYAQVLDNTMKKIEQFNNRDLVTTTINLALIVKKVGDDIQKQNPKGSPYQVLHNILVGDNSENKHSVFSNIAVNVSEPKLRKFDARELSSFVYAYSIVGFVPVLGNGRSLFDILARQIIPKVKEFDSKQLSSIVWAYAKLDQTNPQLFRKVGDHIVALNSLREFSPQSISIIVWSYATMNQHHTKLFEKVANHILALGDLREFSPQNLSNLVWAYATAKVHHPELFTKLGDHIIAFDTLKDFKPQELSNTVWAYATAGVANPYLFQKLSETAIKRRHRFNCQEASNTLWAFASNGEIEENLFRSFVPRVKALKSISLDTSQGVANIAWAYAVANVTAAPSLFDSEFIDSCIKRSDEFSPANLSQLHQWRLWQEENKSDIKLPPSFAEKCYNAFIEEKLNTSRLQHDVISELSRIGLQPREEILLKTGYRLDAIVKVKGRTIGVEVDGPSHFVGKSLTGSTILKHRQVTNLDGISLVCIPYWQWNKLNGREKKQEYLRALFVT